MKTIKEIIEEIERRLEYLDDGKYSELKDLLSWIKETPKTQEKG